MVDPRDSSGTPRWVKAFAIVAAVVVVLALIVLISRGGHGPGRHTSAAAVTVGR
jgi:hypothetical protein